MDIKKAEATDLTVESLLETITEDYLKCHICLNTFTDPKFLDCHHTFCQSCLEDLRNSQSHPRRELVCPDCRHKTSLTGRGTSGLKPNFTMASLVGDTACNKKLLRIQQGAIICSLCESEALAAVHCTDCDERLCETCWVEQGQTHDSHTVDILEKTEPGAAAPKCKRHRDQGYCLYCNTCKALICAMCAATVHRSLEHEHLSVDEADNNAREELCILLSRSEKQLQDYVTQKDSIESERSKMEDAIAHVVTTIEQDYAPDPDNYRVLEELREFQQAREEDLSNALDSVGAKVDWVQHVCDSVSKRVADADKFQLLQQKEELFISIENTLLAEIPAPEFPILNISLGRHYFSERLPLCTKALW